MKAFFLFVGALALSACADHGVALQQPVGITTARPRSGLADPAAFVAVPNDAAPAHQETTNPCDDLPVVSFMGSSTAVSEAQGDTLWRLADCLNAPPHEEATVVLIGYTDLIGTVPANIELGITRAQSVMRHIVEAGVAPGRVVVASAGELQRPSARTGLHAPRVEILLARGGPARPNEAPITRGVDAAGLMRRPPKAPSPPAATPRTPPTRPVRSR